MVRDYIKIINFGNNYLIHITPEMNIIVNKSFIYKNINDLLINDIFFGKVSNTFYSFYQLNKVVNRIIKSFIFRVVIAKK
jgi:hypothetical protein